MNNKLKKWLKTLPGLPLFIKTIRRFFFKSQKYWEIRYATGGTSGAGSYGRLAEHKAEVINSFIARNQIHSVLELGCGDGNQLSLGDYQSYIGLDVSVNAINICRKRFAGDKSKTFLPYNCNGNFQIKHSEIKVELALSLDVIFHLVEDRIFYSYMKDLFSVSHRFVIIYSSNFDAQTARHVRHRNFTKWINNNFIEWKLIERIPNRYPLKNDPENESFADFYIFAKKIKTG